MNARRAQHFQRQDGAARRAARAQQHHGFAVQAADIFAQGFRQADAVGVAAFDFSVRERPADWRRPPHSAAASTLCAMAKAASLCGTVTLTPAKPGAAHAVDHRGEILAPRRQRHHGAVNAMLGQPMAMQHRRQRMADRPADDAGEFCFSRQAHDAKTPSLRSWARTGSSGRPSTEK